MRYYDLTITNAKGQVLVATEAGFVITGQAVALTPGARLGTRQSRFASASPSTTFSSQVQSHNGQYVNNPGALHIEFDIPAAPFATPQGPSSIKIYGVPLEVIGQASNLNPDPSRGVEGASVTLSGGMMKGLPLANESQAGVLIQGQVLQAYGNWQGPQQTLDLVVQAGGDQRPPNGITVNWFPKQKLSDAIKAALTPAFPKLKQKIYINEDLLQTDSTQPVVTHHRSLSQLAGYLIEATQSYGQKITGDPSYSGVQILIDPASQAIVAFDGTLPINPTISLEIQDFIGQPTWIGPSSVSFKMVMRADIAVGDTVLFPSQPITPFAVTTIGAAVPNAPARNSSVFQGAFLVTEVHHFASFRQPDGDAWCTAFVATSGAELSFD